MRTLTISLSRQQVERVQGAVESGDYASNSEVIREALRLWERQEELRSLDIARLKQAYEEGLASGPGRKLDVEALLTGFKAKAAGRGRG